VKKAGTIRVSSAKNSIDSTGKILENSTTRSGNPSRRACADAQDSRLREQAMQLLERAKEHRHNIKRLLPPYGYVRKLRATIRRAAFAVRRNDHATEMPAFARHGMWSTSQAFKNQFVIVSGEGAMRS